MAVTGQDLPGLHKPADARRRTTALTRLWDGVAAEAGKGIVRVSRFLGAIVFGSLTRRIIVLNLVALAVLVTGILYLNQWRAGLIDARIQSLRVQGEIIAAAIAASATVDSDVIQVDPDRLLQLKQGSNAPVSSFSYYDPSLEFPINPERVAPLLKNLVTPTRTRARIYDQGGFMILDSASIYQRGEVIRAGKPLAGATTGDWWNNLMAWVPGDDFPPYKEYGADEGTKYPEVAAALAGAPADVVRVDAEHQLVISVAVPVQRVRATVGVLLLSTQPGEIDSIVATERWGVLRIALVAATVTIVLSLLLASTIAGPLRRLSEAAEKVQTSPTSREEIPDFTYRTDEVGHLSRALRSMTSSLYNRIEAIERFAADVAHELKNPLTSLRSAVETLPLAKRAEDRERLNAIIQHDVRRLDRLISDISNASRLDAELARETSEPVDFDKLTETMVGMQHDLAASRNVEVILEKQQGKFAATTVGHDSRLAQVINNLIDNAVSFSPPGGKVSVRIATTEDKIVTTVKDEGPGIRGDISRIFQRFYTDRPDGEHFGDHSGLGLAISKQIIDAHRGTIVAENRSDRSGALFTVTLPRTPLAPTPEAAQVSAVNIHATGLVLGKTGLILRGPSGAGKSLLALELLDLWEMRGESAKLVSDDRIDIEATPKGLVMTAPRAIEGLIELRGRGIVSRPFARQAPLHLVVDLVDSLERMVEEDALTTDLEGVDVARCPVPRAGVVDSRHQLLLIREALRALSPAPVARKKTA